MITLNQSATVAVKPCDTFLGTNGQYGEFGGAYVPDVLKKQLQALHDFFSSEVKKDHFQNEFIHYLKSYVGRPSPLFKANNLSEAVNATVYLKREDLNHTGAHKINNALGQILLAKRMGATEVIAETGAGQHGVATATAAALLKIPCRIFMGVTDAGRQSLNVKQMKLLGAAVETTKAGRGTLKNAVDAALGYYVDHPKSYYLLGSQVGPHPYPKIVGYFQSVIGQEARQQIMNEENRLPNSIFACIGGGSNAIGIFSAFLKDANVNLYGAEGGGSGHQSATASTLNYGKPKIFQGSYSYCLVDKDNQPQESSSIAAGLDYPGISPQHAHLNMSGRAVYEPITDGEALEAYKMLTRLEGIQPAIESSHAVALAVKHLKDTGSLAIINISGRGDKDLDREF